MGRWIEHDQPDSGCVMNTEKSRLRQQIRELKEQLAEEKHAHKLVDEDTKHLMRLCKEKHAVENERLNLERDRCSQAKIATIRDESRDKILKQLMLENNRLETMFSDALGRLPKVSVKQSSHEER